MLRFTSRRRCSMCALAMAMNCGRESIEYAGTSSDEASMCSSQADVVTVVVHLLLLESVRITARAALPHGTGLCARSRSCRPNLGTILAHCRSCCFQQRAALNQFLIRDQSGFPIRIWACILHFLYSV